MELYFSMSVIDRLSNERGHLRHLGIGRPGPLRLLEPVDVIDIAAGSVR